MDFLCFCKFHKDLVEKLNGLCLGQDQILAFQHSRASNSKFESKIWPNFALVQDFIPFLVTCKFDKDPIKSEGAILLTIVSPLKSTGNIFSIQGQ